jgi:DNA polymerase (family 10)
MLPDNYYIADQFSMLSKLMDIHGENSFKSKSYSIAAFNIERLPVQLSDVGEKEMYTLKGIGDSVGKKVQEIIREGHLHVLEEYVKKTPAGVMEMLSIKGLGPKKIATIWKEMEIESLGELLYACHENRLARFKGFGEKTQKSIEEAITFFQKSQGSRLYAQVETYAHQLQKVFSKSFPKNEFAFTGAFRRQLEVIDFIEWVTTVPVTKLQAYFEKNNYKEEEAGATNCSFRSPENLLLKFYNRPQEEFALTLFETSCSENFLSAWNKLPGWKSSPIYKSEDAIFFSMKIHPIPAFQREYPEIIEKAKKEKLPVPVQPDDITAIIHSHSTWSDGSNSIHDMAKDCIRRGLQYLVISDHSKSAFYANGLPEERIAAQHEEIDALNKKLKPFRIFKSIECDILNDGALDYSPEILKTFDVVITSIHSNLKMTEEKAMMRLMNAIKNPFTSILGHLTGRLLLSRNGYPVDYKTIIDACHEHAVAIEVNANPRRLDMTWEWVSYAMERGVLLSVNPDAHDVAEFDHCRYGVLVAQKGGLVKERNLSSFSLGEFERFVKTQQLKRR